VVSRGRSKYVPAQLFAYSFPYLASYIFLRDPPDRLRTPAKYFVRHEIAHVLLAPQYTRSFLWLANRGLLFSLFWAVWTLSWSLQAALLFAALLSTALSLRGEIKRRTARFRLADEASADAFALSTLSQEELRQIEVHAAKPTFLADGGLSAEDNVTRQGCFQENVRRLRRGESDLQTNFDDLSKTPVSALSAALLLIALAQHSVAPSATFLKGVALGFLLPMLILLVVFGALLLALGGRIDRLLGDQGHLLAPQA
jgi:hypothetical protein